MLIRENIRHEDGSPVRILRTEPVQGRSSARLAQIEAAARTVIARHGRDAFTTQHIADEAGCSIGTVYRYFVDRVAVLDHLYPERSEGLTGDAAVRIAAINEALNAVHTTLIAQPLTLKALDSIRDRLLQATS